MIGAGANLRQARRDRRRSSSEDEICEPPTQKPPEEPQTRQVCVDGCPRDGTGYRIAYFSPRFPRSLAAIGASLLPGGASQEAAGEASLKENPA